LPAFDQAKRVVKYNESLCRGQSKVGLLPIDTLAVRLLEINYFQYISDALALPQRPKIPFKKIHSFPIKE